MLDSLGKSCWFQGCLLLFVLGLGDLREGPEAPGWPTEGPGGLPGGFGAPGTRAKTNLEIHTCWSARLSGTGLGGVLGEGLGN